MGRISAPFGIKGWVKVQPFTATPGSLLAYPVWWIGEQGRWRTCRIEQAQVQSGAVVAKPEGCDDRDAAALYRDTEIAVPREAFPATAANEFYWTDLIGLEVVNGEGIDLGTVTQVIGTGANDVLVVDGTRERLIPFTEQAVKEVDTAARVVHVDWGVDY